MAKALDRKSEVWPKPKLMLYLTRVSADTEGLGVEISQRDFQKIYQALYYDKQKDIRLVHRLEDLYADYLECLKQFLIQRSFGLYARIPWSILRTQFETNKLRERVFGNGNDDRQMRGLFSERDTPTGPILQPDAVLDTLGAKAAGRNQDAPRRMARKERIDSRSRGSRKGRLPAH